MHCRTRRARLPHNCGGLVACALLWAAIPGIFLAIASTAALAGGSTDHPEAARDVVDMSLDELLNLEIGTVTGASRHEQTLADAPSSVTVISRDEIQIHGYRTLGEILAGVRGMYVTYDRNYTYIGVRGVSSPGDYTSKILILVDGHRVNDSLYDSAPAGSEFPLDLNLIERIEVIRGAGSSLYGTSACLAVINITTRQPQDLPDVGVSTQAGSLDTRSMRLTISRGGENRGVAISAMRAVSAGQRTLAYPEFKTPEQNNGLARNLDGDEATRVFATAVWRDWRAQGGYSARRKEVPTASFGTIFNDPESRTQDDYGWFDLNYRRVSKRGIDVSTRVTYDRYECRGVLPFDYGMSDVPERALYHDETDGSRLSTEAGATVPLTATSRITGGLEYRNNLSLRLKTYDPFDVYVDRDDQSSLWAAYLQHEMQVCSFFRLNAGLRHDQYSTFGGTTNPRLAAHLLPTSSTTVKILYGRAFRAPNAYELLYEGGGNKGNRDLLPERIATSEVVLEQNVTEAVGLSAGIYQEDLHGLIAEVEDEADGLRVYRNLGRARVRGFESAIHARWPSGWGLRANYSRVRAEDTRTGDRLSNAPAHLANLSVEAPLIARRLFVGTRLSYQGVRKTLQAEQTPEAWLWDVSLNDQGVFHGLGISGGITNLLDEVYFHPGSEEHLMDQIQQDGRLYWLSVGYRLF